MDYFKILILFSLILSKEDLRFQYNHKQEFDKSCGFSSISSLLSIYWNINVMENDIISNFLYLKKGTNDITNFLIDVITNTNNLNSTLADLSQILLNYGIYNKSYKMNYDELNEAIIKYKPVLVHYKDKISHFALVFNIINDFISILDPSSGLVILSKEQFLKKWSGVVMLTASNEKIKNEEIITKLNNKILNRINFMEKLIWLK